MGIPHRKKEETIQYYESIKDLILWSWDRYLATKDNNFFIVGYDGRQPKIVNEKLAKLEKTLQDEYFIEVNDRDFNKKIEKWMKIDNLQTKYTIINMILDRMWIGFPDSQMDVRASYINKLNKLGFKMPLINSVIGDAEEILRIREELKGIITQINIIKDELKTDAVVEHRSLNLQLKMMSKAMEFGFQLNSKELTVSEWIELCKELKTLAAKN
jgi:predicted ATPase